VEKVCAAISVEDITNINAFSIYPNPSSGKITLETTGEGHLTIVNLNDQATLTRQIIEPKTQIDISNLPDGVFFVRLTNERTIEVVKIIKQGMK